MPNVYFAGYFSKNLSDLYKTLECVMVHNMMYLVTRVKSFFHF